MHNYYYIISICYISVVSLFLQNNPFAGLFEIKNLFLS
jgi:hypothetical protein